MGDVPKKRKWARWITAAVIGVPCLWFVLAPFPGIGMIYSITDSLRGHPGWSHGSHPSEFIGLWVKDVPEDFGFVSGALSFSQDGQMPNFGMTFRSWHAEKKTLYIDRVSGCGNCYSGVVTDTYSAEFDGSDRMRLTRRPLAKDGRGIGGWYTRTRITDELKQRMTMQADEDDYARSSQARAILAVIEQIEVQTK